MACPECVVTAQAGSRTVFVQLRWENVRRVGEPEPYTTVFRCDSCDAYWILGRWKVPTEISKAELNRNYPGLQLDS
jgi:hypothetical protein